MGGAFTGKPRPGARPRSFGQCPQALFHKALAGALDRDAARGDLLGNFFIAKPFSGFQQNAGTSHLARGRLARADERQERLSLFRS
jgi:hypothetical protein